MEQERNKLSIPPTTLSFITTNKCTAACKNCCFGCNPKNDTRLSLSVMKNHVDEAVTSYPTIRSLVLTGGECFTLGEDLLAIIAYATQKGLRSRVVTNAYWASTFKRAYRMIEKLQKAGLHELNISTGDEHLEWVPFDNVVNVIAASIMLNMIIVVNIESSEYKDFKRDRIFDDPRLRKFDLMHCANVYIVNGRWIYFDEAGEDVEKEEKNILLSNISGQRCVSLFYSLSINYDNTVIACCGITSLTNKYLTLGKADKFTLKELYEYQFDDFVKIWLFTEGPLKILDFCYEHRHLPKFKGNAHMCQICAMIFSDPENVRVLQEHYSERVQKVYFEYSLLKRKYVKQLNLLQNEKQK